MDLYYKNVDKIRTGDNISSKWNFNLKISLNYNPVGIYYEILRSENPNLNASRQGSNSVKLNPLQRRLMFTLGIALFQSTKKSRRRVRR